MAWQVIADSACETRMSWHSGGPQRQEGGGRVQVKGTNGSLRARWRQLAALAGAILAIQAIYWLAIEGPLFRKAPSNDIVAIEPTDFEIARLSQPSVAALATARFAPADPVFTHCCDTASFAARMRITLDKVPGTGLGVISTLQVDNYLLLVNGSLVAGEGRMVPGNQSFHGQKTYLTRIPAGLLRSGANDLTYITVRDGFPYSDIYPPIIAEYDSLDRYSARRLWVMGSFPLYSGLVLAMLGLVAAIMTARSDDRRFAGWLSLLCAAFAANALYGVLLDPPFGGWGRMLAFFAVNLAVPTAVLGFVDVWTGRPLRWLGVAVLTLYGAAMVAIAALLFGTAMPGAYDNPALLWSWYHLAFAAVTLLRILWHFASVRDDRIAECAILTVLVAAGFVDGLSLFFPGVGWMEGNLMHAAPFLMLAMITAFIARNIRLFQSQQAIADLLRGKVAEREAELERAHARERQLVRAAAHDDERRRIMRDLHDGLGSQLMSMLLAARVGVAEPAQVAEGLQTVVDEMRLMVDSMDSVGESLGTALITFRQRVEPRVIAAGVGFGWDNRLDGDIPGYGPRDVLQVFRVLQEAVTNALKHADARRISVTVAEGSEAGSLSLSVADDGKGVDGRTGSGRGLANMQSRAKALDGTVEISTRDGGGTIITLALPPRVATEPA